MTESARFLAKVRDVRTPEHLPMAGLLALAMTGFIAILTETLPAGLLPEIGRGLGVTPVMAGQLVTLYALGSLVAAIPLTVATRGWRRRSTLLVAIGGLLVFNTVTTISTSYSLTLLSRFLAGVAAGLAWGLLAGYARRMVDGKRQGQALAVAMVGTPIALSIGTPLGTWLGAIAGWRMSFGIMSALTLVLVGWVLISVPDFSGQRAGETLPVRQVFMKAGIRPVLLVIFLWMLGHNVLYIYISSFLVPAGLGGRVDLVLLIFGLTALIGIWVTGMLVDRWLRVLVLLSLSVFGAASLALGAGGSVATVVFIAVAVWGLSFGGAATLLQTASADAAGEHVDLATAMVTTVWNLAIAAGGAVGGVLLATAGTGSMPWMLVAVASVAFLVAWNARQNSFVPGRRKLAGRTSAH